MPVRNLGRRGGTRLGALTAVLALLLGLLVAFTAPASADPANPSDAQIAAAAAQKSALATQVGSLTAQLATLQNEVAQLSAAAELAEQKVALAQQQLADAQQEAVTAKQDVASAQDAVTAARSKFNASVRASYMQGTIDAGGALLTATDPTAMLQASALQTYVQDHQVDAIGVLDRATVAKANADAAARAAVDRQAQLAAAAQSAMQDARAAEAAAEAQQTQTLTQQTSVQAQLDTAQAALLGLQNQRAAYDAWKAEQARLAAIAEAARQAALLAARTTSSGGGGGSGTQSSGNPSGGSWTAARGQDAVNRAMAWKGERYSFAAGNYNGPTYGVCGSGDDGNNDCHVFGFDCSGLALYAWAPYLHMAHYAATQYGQAGSYHPGIGNLLPGDLVFWSSNGTRAGIHHVAIYIGGGNVIQAPHSGDVVKITNLFDVDSGYYGATRPLT